MVNAATVQEVGDEKLPANTQAFRFEYGRLNSSEQREVQNAFCERYNVSHSAFRSRLSGDSTRVSETELAWMRVEVAKYFPR